MHICEYDDNLWVTLSPVIIPLPYFDPDFMGDAMVRLQLGLNDAELEVRELWKRAPRAVKRLILAAICDGNEAVDALRWMVEAMTFGVPDNLVPVPVPGTAVPVTDPDAYLEEETK